MPVKGREFLASCPKCKTFETVWLTDGVLTPTRKFKQGKGGKIYHDCGSQFPCILFPRFIGEKSKWVKK